ncbi:MAG TPA: hypothetical protein VIX17_11290 [Pyrinomonadaceae bacterium]|jgi:hypothetical protein
MRKLSFVLIATTIIGLSPAQFVSACGDKTMRVKTGLRYYQTQIAKHPSKILIHSAALPAGKANELRDFLNKVGHQATALDDVSSIKNDLRSSRYDLVLTNLAEAPDLQKQVESFTPNTRVVPVLFKQPEAEAKAAAKQYKVIVKNPKDGLDFVIAIAKVMDSQSRKS